MANLLDIIMNNKKVYDYRIKYAFEPTEKQLTRTKQVLEKYDIVSTDPLKKTIFQNKPIDFFNLDCGEIWMLDVSVATPIQHDIVLAELATALQASKALILVGNKIPPQSTYDQYDDLDFDKEYTAKLTDTNYTDAKIHDVNQLAGNKFIEDVIKATVDDYSNERTPYAEFMGAGWSAQNTKSKE